MDKIKVILIGLIVVLLLFGICSHIFKPPEADYDDYVFEDIGGDKFLNVTMDYCLKIKEENIPDGSFKVSTGEIKYFDAKNITYADMSGNQDYFIVWKTTPDKYDWIVNESVNQYISDYLTNGKGKCFVEYSYEDNYVYGVMVSTANENFTESDLMYDILGLPSSGFELGYTSTSPSYGGYSSYDSGSSYHTVVPDRYTLSRTDPGAYYDHYEYGDNYDIDNYLESEGYD